MEISFSLKLSLEDYQSAEARGEAERELENLRSVIEAASVRVIPWTGEPGQILNFSHLDLLGRFALLLEKASPAVITAIGAWLVGRNGRKARVKVGDVEAEAQTPEEAKKLLEWALTAQQQKEPKKIL